MSEFNEWLLDLIRRQMLEGWNGRMYIQPDHELGPRVLFKGYADGSTSEKAFQFPKLAATAKGDSDEVPK